MNLQYFILNKELKLNLNKTHYSDKLKKTPDEIKEFC